MITVALCDDELETLDELRILLDQYRAERGREIRYAAFHSPFDLLSEFEKGNRFDILFLDVLMPGVNGIEAAREIRQHDKTVEIIFLTSSAAFAVESYAVGAFFYQLKPIWKESFFRLMDAVIEQCGENDEAGLILHCKTGIARIAFEKLEYCEALGHTLLFHLTDGGVLESAGGMDRLTEQLAGDGRFLRIHRSYLVNMGHIKNIEAKNMTMSSQVRLPIPRGKYAPIKDAYLEYAFQRKQVFV